MSSTVVARRRRALLLLATATCLAVGTVGCGQSSPSAAPNPAPTASTAAGVLEIRDPWVKAADSGMTAAFATLVNPGDSDVTITGAATDVSPMELHEMAMQDGKMVMRAKAGGIVVKAHGSTTLEPGGDHLMMMDLKQPVKAGDEVGFTLRFADGKTQTFQAVAKPFTGAQESYAPGHGEPMPGMSATAGTSPSPAA
ncbi:copper chaperone PCu(A)C [Micromonospora krabiensis]|uniref:copper chaperone PCu(A)C n=1 Tax=Micromonospora krabiensis TaxID=307121 RepID=UPI0036174929